MLDFMIIGLPRSATTWASNWLTTDTTHCTHDPLYTTHYSEWDGKLTMPRRISGVSCTGIWRFPDYLASHPARKLILHRSLPAINASLAALGLPGCTLADVSALGRIEGKHLDYADLFTEQGAEFAWEFLTAGQPFNRPRWRELKQIEMQPNFAGLSVGAEVTRKLVAELQSALG